MKNPPKAPQFKGVTYESLLLKTYIDTPSQDEFERAKLNLQAAFIALDYAEATMLPLEYFDRTLVKRKKNEWARRAHSDRNGGADEMDVFLYEMTLDRLQRFLTVFEQESNKHTGIHLHAILESILQLKKQLIPTSFNGMEKPPRQFMQRKMGRNDNKS